NGPEALKHLNRALRLHPAHWQGHRLAARTLAELGRRPQAALEYRLASECGVPASYDELLRVVGPYVVEAVPQKVDDLIKRARILARGRPKLADAAAKRAADLSGNAEGILVERVSIAALGKDKALVSDAAAALLAANPSASAIEVAATELSKVGESSAA